MIAALAIPLFFGSCRSSKQVQQSADQTLSADTLSQRAFLQHVADQAQHVPFITSKVKFTVAVGNQTVELTGNLRMKRNDVIRLQLMAFGFVEAGRIEFTKEYVLIMDRINKLYMKANYAQLDFLRNTGLNFYSLQSLFWNELFQPGKTSMTDELLKNFQINMEGEEAIISYEHDKLAFRWLADKDVAKLKMANIVFSDKYRGNTQLNWDYEDFERNGKKLFPMRQTVRFTTDQKEVKFSMRFNYMGADEDWETRTAVSAKYREVTVDEIMRRFMAL